MSETFTSRLKGNISHPSFLLFGLLAWLETWRAGHDAATQPSCQCFQEATCAVAVQKENPQWSVKYIPQRAQT